MNRKNVVGMFGVLVAGLWLAHTAVAAETFKVAVMDQQAVMEQSKAGKRALEEMKSYSVTRQKIVNSDDQELKDLEQIAAGSQQQAERAGEAGKAGAIPDEAGGLSASPG